MSSPKREKVSTPTETIPTLVNGDASLKGTTDGQNGKEASCWSEFSFDMREKRWRLIVLMCRFV